MITGRKKAGVLTCCRAHDPTVRAIHQIVREHAGTDCQSCDAGCGAHDRIVGIYELIAVLVNKRDPALVPANGRATLPIAAGAHRDASIHGYCGVSRQVHARDQFIDARGLTRIQGECLHSRHSHRYKNCRDANGDHQLNQRKSVLPGHQIVPNLVEPGMRLLPNLVSE